MKTGFVSAYKGLKQKRSPLLKEARASHGAAKIGIKSKNIATYTI